MKVFETPEEAAPMTAETPSAMSAVADWVAMSVVVSPESLCSTSTVMPLAASLISLTARSTPANSGGPRTASVPVWGRIVPILRERSSAEPPVSPSSVDAQPLRTSAAAPASARPLRARRAARGADALREMHP
jgi:hypothetical protein